MSHIYAHGMIELFKEIATQEELTVLDFLPNPESRVRGGGGRVQDNDGKIFWGRIRAYDAHEIGGHLYNGVPQSSLLKSIDKPFLYKTLEKHSGDQMYRLDVLEFVTEPAISTRPWLPVTHQPLSLVWWHSLRSNIEKIQSHTTHRIAIRDDLVKRRLDTWFPGAYRAYSLATCHGDLHWGNVTQNKLTILDWESWGEAPKWFDAALLLTYSGKDDVFSQGMTIFPELATNEGSIAIRFAVAELLEMNLRFGDNKPILAFLLSLRKALA